MPAVRLLKMEELSPDMREMIETYDAWVGDTIFARVMAHLPEPFKAFNTFYGLVLNGQVDSEIKELARLKMARLNNCDY